MTLLHYLILCILLLPLTFGAYGKSEQDLLLADFRHRPPEMIIDGNSIRGPLKDILEEAAEKIGLKVKWRVELFSRSLKDLEQGSVDIVPKTFYRESRTPFVQYLGPLFKRTQRIHFLVRKGKENTINQYDDLKKFTVATKRSSFYFEQFNNDTTINKFESFDDFNMSEMFIKGRFDVMAVIDLPPIEDEFRKRGFTDYSYANYFHEREMGLYYGMSKKSPKIKYQEKLNSIFLQMVRQGRIAEIYKKYHLDPMTINTVLQGDFRHRPPEMTVEGSTYSGPIKQIIEEALNRMGIGVQWSLVPFASSIGRLEQGFVDIVPRMIKTDERSKSAYFLGPIGHFEKDIFFIVPRGKEDSIKQYSDLKKLRVGIKKGTHYFDQFQEDRTITKIEALDDESLSHMFIKGRFDAMAILDPHPIVEALHRRNFSHFSFASYRYKNQLDIYYALSKKSKFGHLASDLQKILEDMTKLGEVDEVFKRYNMVPPKHR